MFEVKCHLENLPPNCNLHKAGIILLLIIPSQCLAPTLAPSRLQYLMNKWMNRYPLVPRPQASPPRSHSTRVSVQVSLQPQLPKSQHDFQRFTTLSITNSMDKFHKIGLSNRGLLSLNHCRVEVSRHTRKDEWKLQVVEPFSSSLRNQESFIF